ncbi:hypothetical protein [Endozoicomonas sp. SESOKO1]|uniref:hypothetical protein n=1 Tax=Endozoicomonas sp. SESOKO1 TaxID=2828742 RepID=UPI002147F8A9|nr:hypothetical protein [Endozoicomonas sp. SESOKO1]
MATFQNNITTVSMENKMLDKFSIEALDYEHEQEINIDASFINYFDPSITRGKACYKELTKSQLKLAKKAKSDFMSDYELHKNLASNFIRPSTYFFRQLMMVSNYWRPMESKHAYLYAVSHDFAMQEHYLFSSNSQMKAVISKMEQYQESLRK